MIKSLKVGATLRFPFPMYVAPPSAVHNETLHMSNGSMLITLPQRRDQTSQLINKRELFIPKVREEVNHQISYTPYSVGGVCYVQTNGMVVSSGFSGCLMAVYLFNNQRRVAHVYAEAGALVDCKQYFRNLMTQANYQFIQYFRPYTDHKDGQFQVDVIKRGVNLNYYGGIFAAQQAIVTFGFVSATNQCYSVSARKIDDQNFDILRVRRSFPSRNVNTI
ncbi:hypothetical protein [Catalinimonas niigatensis]|uniref:hypothetical protein n=1 Tax=Catalinimonas niigatensis TaxID=1397264 RepID=UPI002665CB9E|nr:hypothetical protein [Catalinimonas niigatensis]WPP52442.1 hypothetical protein PZB72_08605 [Catalinimonas niigatensis]